MNFHVSLLLSFKEAVVSVIEKNAAASVAKVESAACAVSAAQFEYLKASLAADWDTIAAVKAAVPLLGDELHLWNHTWLNKQVENGKEAVTWYMAKYLRMHCAAHTSWQKTIVEDFQLLEQRHNIRRKDIHVLMFYDMNGPLCGTKSRVKAVGGLASWASAESPTHSVGICITPDIANKGAKHGVQDDEANFLSEWNGVGLNVDARFSMWTERDGGQGDEASGNTEGALPAATFGRLAFQHPKQGETLKNNKFFSSSKLSRLRRPNKIAMMPAFGAILHTESLNPDADVYARDRTAKFETLPALA